MNIFCFTLILFAASAFGHEVNNGGDAVKIGNVFYSFDLFENGLEKTPYFDSTVSINANLKLDLEAQLDSRDFPIEVIAKKLTEIYDQDRVFPYLLIKAIGIYTWRLVNGPLKEVNDEQDSVVAPPEGLVQAAVRRRNLITISRPVWEAMDESNRAALVLHEIIYAMLRPESDSASTNLKQNSAIARQTVGFLFSPDLKRKSWKWFLDQPGIWSRLRPAPPARSIFQSGVDRIPGIHNPSGAYFQLGIVYRDNGTPNDPQPLYAQDIDNEPSLHRYCNWTIAPASEIAVSIVNPRYHIYREYPKPGHGEGLFENGYIRYETLIPNSLELGAVRVKIKNADECKQFLRYFVERAPYESSLIGVRF